MLRRETIVQHLKHGYVDRKAIVFAIEILLVRPARRAELITSQLKCPSRGQENERAVVDSRC